MKPNLFIVGAPKCGTQSMYFYLKQHPSVFMSKNKEPLFFGEDIHTPAGVNDEKEYLKLFSKATTEKYKGEGSVWYLFSKLAAYEIKDYSPNSKIIIMIREPTETMHSLHSWNLHGDEWLSFEKALAVEEERKKGKFVLENTPFPPVLFYKETVSYTNQIKRYLDIFGEDNVHIIVFDDLKKNTSKEFKKVCDFLKISSCAKINFNIQHHNFIERNKTLKKIIKSRHPLILFIKKKLPWKLRLKIAPLINVLYFNKEVKRKKMDKNLKEKLKKQFKEEVINLSKLLERDLVKLWGY